MTFRDPMRLLMFCRWSWSIAWGVALCGTLAAAATPDQAATEQVQARLFAETLGVQPGRPLVLAVQQRIAPGWHTYWKEPGEAGRPTTIGWQLPPGAVAGEIAWPTPVRFQQGPITSIGYANEVTLLTTVQVPDTLPASGRFDVQATVDWLVCREVCVPQQVQLSLSLPVLATVPKPSADAGWIQTVRAALPGDDRSPGAAPGGSSGEPADATPGLWMALWLAFAGGLVLNLMPCVFPVLSIKALALLQQAGASRRAVALQGLAYTAGVLASFVVLAGALLGLKAGGASVGWGFQFQSPAFVAGLALLMAAVGLNLSGVYTVGASFTGVGGALADRGGLAGSFFTGVLATVVATPCTAPFMGAALGAALTQPAPLTLAIFLSLGLGLAAPYLLLCAWPALQRWLPRPGPWMERLKQALAFPMYAAAAWLVWVLSLQGGPAAVAAVLAGLLLLALGAWLIGSAQTGAVAWRRLGTLGGAAAVLAGAVTAVGLVHGGLRPDVEAAAPGADRRPSGLAGDWTPYTPERLQALRDSGQPVFVNLTAAWCITCLVNERVALGRSDVDTAFQRAHVTRLKGDWTQRDESITRLLAEQGRTGVPLYLYYAAGAQQPRVLPQLLTPAVILDALADRL